MRCNCPVCEAVFGIPGVRAFAEAEGATCDCPHCEATLIVKQGVLRDFHEYMNSKNAAWPVDGKNTGVIELRE